MVPLACAMAKKNVTPASRTMIPIGKPSSTASSDMSARNNPTPHAVASMTTPRCTRRRFAMAKAATKMAIARSCNDIPGPFGVETYN